MTAVEPFRYKNKVTIVTGGSKGIGRGCVKVFEADGRKLESELNEKGPGECFFVKCDMKSEEDIKNLIDTTVSRYGQIDCLINNAGWHPPGTDIDDFSGDDFKDLLNFNLVSYFLATKYALPHLRKTKGNIINDSSLVATLGQPKSVTYVATKGGITAMTRAVAIDEAKHGVRANTISPGNIWTPLWDSVAKSTKDPEKTVKTAEDAQLLGRFGTEEECGKACLFLAADATFCTGIDLNLSGGAELSYGIKNPEALQE